MYNPKNKMEKQQDATANDVVPKPWSSEEKDDKCE